MDRPGENSVLDRLLLRLEVDLEAGCWIWQGAKTPDGYGQIGVGGRPLYVHRLVYEASFGKPEAQVHHACRVPACANPFHLLDVTPGRHAEIHQQARRENLLRIAETMTPALSPVEKRAVINTLSTLANRRPDPKSGLLPAETRSYPRKRPPCSGKEVIYKEEPSQTANGDPVDNLVEDLYRERYGL